MEQASSTSSSSEGARRFSCWRRRLAGGHLGLVPAILGLFSFYVAHDALQELNFRQHDFRFGWFMTAVEIGTMFAAAYIWEGSGGRGGKATHRSSLVFLAFVIAVSQGTGSVALNFVTYPVKVAFKSCKLVPTMAFSTLFVDRRYTATEYAAAVLMCLSLMGLGLADARAVGHDARRTKAQALGYILLTVACASDAMIPNLQERLLRQLHWPVGRMVIVSNCASFILVVAWIAASGELAEATRYCLQHKGTAACLLLQALTAYCGLRCYLYVVKSRSGVAGVLTTSARKVVTIILSFLLFEKPCSALHGFALALLAAGVALALATKPRRQHPSAAATTSSGGSKTPSGVV